LSRSRSSASRSSASVAIEATQLLGKWSVLSQRHLAFGAGCSMCAGFFGDVRTQDLERQMLEYLRGKHSTKPVVAALLADGRASISELLKSIAKLTAKRSEEIDALLADMRRSIESIEELHRG
jgi:hypothetical protein